MKANQICYLCSFLALRTAAKIRVSSWMSEECCSRPVMSEVYSGG